MSAVRERGSFKDLKQHAVQNAAFHLALGSTEKTLLKGKKKQIKSIHK